MLCPPGHSSRLKIIGQLGGQRSDLLKNVPAVNEGQALKNFSYKIWTGFMVPRNTPEDVVQRLHGAIGRTLGLEWGGDWKSIQDEPHFQVVPEKNLKLIAAKFQAGETFI